MVASLVVILGIEIGIQLISFPFPTFAHRIQNRHDKLPNFCIMSQELDQHYLATLENIKEKIRQAQFKAALSVNYRLLQLYWEIGNMIAQKQIEQGWGAKVIDLLSADLRKEFPGTKGLSSRNLRYMRDFAKTYPDLSIWQPVVAKLL